MAKGSLYSLVFLFNGSEISLDDLRQKAAKAIGRHLSDVDLQLIPIDPQRLQLSIVGSLESVDACHDKINRELFDRHSCVRLHDEAGVEIRQQAYPILARIEQLLRDFINRAMIEVAGFDWWDSMTPPSIRTKVREVEKKSGRIAVIHHPLEFTDFDHLVQIITGSVQEWAEDRPFSVADFLEVLSDCDSMEEVQTKLENKIRRISLWDAVFVRYFERTDQWSELKEDIRKFVIPARNEVMHHRPMRLYELRNLSRIEEGIRALLASAKAELSQEERVEARRISLDFIDVIRRQQEELARTMLEPFRRQQEELARTMLEPIRRQQEELARTMLEPIRRQQQEWARIMLEPIRRQQEEWARIMLEPIQRWQEQMTRTTRQIVELPMSEFREDESEHKDFEPDVNSVDDDA
ncbi:MAG: hypothetical protein H8D43_00530 [Chloroflexi bacterium]|nr:hypothetical protein [Chloroflexota bacterium]